MLSTVAASSSWRTTLRTDVAIAAGSAFVRTAKYVPPNPGGAGTKSTM
jgi:hypothetical protein